MIMFVLIQDPTALLGPNDRVFGPVNLKYVYPLKLQPDGRDFLLTPWRRRHTRTWPPYVGLTGRPIAGCSESKSILCNLNVNANVKYFIADHYLIPRVFASRGTHQVILLVALSTTLLVEAEDEVLLLWKYIRHSQRLYRVDAFASLRL